MIPSRLSTLALVALGIAAGIPTLAGAGEERPPILRNVGIDQRLGEPVPSDLSFRDETGRLVRLGDYFGRRPVILTLNYYRCPMLCTMILNGLVSGLRPLAFEPGREFEMVTVSIDPRETPALAAEKKAAYLKDYGRPSAAEAWHFLTGDETPIRALAAAVGFHYAWDEASGQFAHAAAIFLLTPEGKISRVFYGVEYAPRDLKLGLIDSAAGRIGSFTDQILLFCYHYDPATGRYSLAALGVMRLGGAITLLLLLGWVAAMLRREVRRRAGATEGRPRAL